MAAAYKAGSKTPDTGAFEDWLGRERLSGHGKALRDRLRREYEKGFNDRVDSEERERATIRRPGAAPGKGTFAPQCSTNLAPYLGVKLCRTADPDLPFATSIDPDSHFDTVQEAHRFIKDWQAKRNPNLVSGALSHGAHAGLDIYDELAGAPSRIARRLVGNPLPDPSSGKYIRFSGHRSRDYALRELSPDKPQSYWSMRRKAGGGIYFLTHAQLEKIKGHRLVRWTAIRGPYDDLRLTWTGNPGNRSNPGSGRALNPESGADKLYESFHGQPPEETVVVEEDFHQHANLTTLGILVELTVVTPQGFECVLGVSDAEDDFDEADAKNPIYLASSEDGKQLYFVSGDQELDLDALKIPKEHLKDDMVIGVLTNLVYRTRKSWDHFKLVDYTHKTGEVSGYEPLLRYDPNTPHLFVTGGSYFINQPLIGTSPGIED